ncbi:MAG: GNAT family protein [Spirosomataceae bacterium]
MFQLQHGRLSIRPIMKKDAPVLFNWRNRASFLANCTHRPTIRTLSDFTKELHTDFQRDRLNQGLICLSGTPIGTIYSYGYHENDAYCYLTIFIDEHWQKSGLGLKAFLLFTEYHFNEYQLYKIYADIYEDNIGSRGLFERLDIPLEGCFKQQHRVGNIRRDVLRFAIYEKDLQRTLHYLS